MFLVTGAWLAAVAGAVALAFAASAGTALTGGGPGFSLIFGGPALAVATDASVGAVLVLRRPDGRFDRARYDAQRTVEGFAAGFRNEFDLERLGGELGAVLGRALAPTSVGVWLRPSLRIPGR